MKIVAWVGRCVYNRGTEVTGLRQLRSFSTELMKLAADVPDADIRELLTHHQIKIANGFDPKMGLAAGNYDLHAKKKKSNSYQKVRDYAATGMKGGLTGLGIMGALNAMRQKKIFPSPSTARRAASLGSSVALLDRAYRHDDLPKTASDIGALGVKPTPANLATPGLQLAQARATGLFRNVNHETEGRKPRSLQLGHKFRVG